MKTFEKSSFLVVTNRFLVSAILFVFLSTIFVMSILVAIIRDNYYSLAQLAKWSFGVIAILTISHLLITKIFMTSFAKRGNRIILLRYDQTSEVYASSVWGKIPYVKIYFPDNWDLSYSITERILNLCLGVKVSDNLVAELTFKIKLGTFGNFRAPDLEQMIKLQNEKSQGNTTFNFKDCLHTFLLASGLKNEYSIRRLLLKYHKKEISLSELDAELSTLISIPSIFSNVIKMEISLSASPKFKSVVKSVPSAISA